MNNPFQLTRAADLNDEQIMKLWVDPEGNFGKRLRPDSQLPMILLGGKGSGKTHLMRYYSYAIQHLQYGRRAMKERVADAKYLGIYARCSGLNASRFSKKLFNESQWSTVFAYYLDLWLGQCILNTASEFIVDSGSRSELDEIAIASDLCELLDEPVSLTNPSVAGFSEHLQVLQRQLDMKVNNAAFGRPFEPRIVTSPGRLIFGIPQKLAKVVPCLRDILFTLFIDEYEHLYEPAQRYVNTLVRERENPVTLKIGARLYGVRTYKTFSGDEELREGSEYELLNLDQALRDNEEAYSQFARKLCVSRVRFSLNGEFPEGWTEATAPERLEECFESSAPVEIRIRARLEGRDGDAPWLGHLKRELTSHNRSVSALGIIGSDDVTFIIDALRFLADPLIEKTNTFLLYRAWSKRQALKDAAIQIKKSADKYFATKDDETDHWRVLDKFRDDLRAQMLHDFELKDVELMQSYIGLPAWIRMSNGIARNLLTTLKHVFDWASFHGETFLSPSGISVRSQAKGVHDASNWFIDDARVLGGDRGLVKAAVNRVASLLRALRFADKPPECSLSTFSVDIDSLDEKSRQVLQTSEQWSLFIRTADRTERNTEANVIKYRINGMIAPRYELPLFTRGSIHFSTEEAAIVLSKAEESEFGRVKHARLARADAPFNLREDNSLKGFSDELGLF